MFAYVKTEDQLTVFRKSRFKSNLFRKNLAVNALDRWSKAKVARKAKSGSATMEYVIVSTFAALLSVAAITFVGRMVKTKVGVMAEKLDMDASEFEFDLGLNQ